MSLNAHHCWGIITADKNKVDDLYNNLILQYPNDEIIRRPDGFYIGKMRIKWIHPDNIVNCRCYRFHRAWIDKDCFEQYVKGYYSTLLLFCERLEDLIWI